MSKSVQTEYDTCDPHEKSCAIEHEKCSKMSGLEYQKTTRNHSLH